MPTYWYTAYGLTFASHLRLPELAEVAAGEADVRIVLDEEVGAIDQPAAVGRIWAAADDEWLQTVDGVGRFRVSSGSRIAIEQWGSDRDVRAFLFGSTLGALLHQRRLLTLHASSFVVDGRAVLVAGRSRAGKSTTLTEMISRGYPMVADDKTVVFGDGDALVTVPGFPSVRLWPDAAGGAGLDRGALATVRDGGDKMVWPAPAIHDARLRIGAVFLLCRSGDVDVRVERTIGPDAFATLLASTYRRDAMLASMGVQQDHFRLASRLASETPVYRLTRPSRRDSVGEVADLLLATVRS